MITLKEIKRYPDTNSVEATWVDRTERIVDVPAAYTEDGELITEAHTDIEIVDVVLRCHSYDQVQMDMLAADLGDDLADNQAIIDEVLANQEPLPVPVVVVPQSISMRQCRLQLLAINKLATVTAALSTAPEAAQIEWEYASSVDRENPLVVSIMTLLDMDELGTDEFFTAAALL